MKVSTPIASQKERTFTVGLVGIPNAGKSTLFNRLTGGNQRIGNYPGVTVERKTGRFVSPEGLKVDLVDLPGTYSLHAQSDDEKIAIEALYGSVKGGRTDSLSLVVVVADAASLERSLGLVLDLKSIGCPIIVAMNMMDLATRRGLKLDFKMLEKILGVPVIPTVSVRKDGVAALLAAVDRHFVAAVEQADTSRDPGLLQRLEALDHSPLGLAQRNQAVESLISQVVNERTQSDKVTDALDRVLLHPVFGLPILGLLLLLVFEAVFSWAAYPMDLIEGGFAALGDFVTRFLPSGWLQDLIVNGMIAGVGSVIVFLPQIVILFFFILLLEGLGYMSRASFLLNRLMSMAGLQGQAAVPLLSSFACAIPGIMATRTIKSPRVRLITMMIAPLMTCSARLPVYTLLVGAFIPPLVLVGGVSLQSLVMLSLFLSAVVSGMIVAFVLKRFAIKGRSAPFVMDLPTYKIPGFSYVANNLWLRAKSFLARAGTLILGISVGLWFLSTYPRPPEDASMPAIHYSFAGRAGKAIEPLVAPIGFDWRIAAGLVPGFAAREVMVGALGTVFAVEDAEESGQETLQQKLAAAWGLPTALALLAWYVFSPQCLATFAVLRRESNSLKWTAFTFLYMLALAWIAAFVVYRLALVFV
jgi:ferrous iron transport protein B